MTRKKRKTIDEKMFDDLKRARRKFPNATLAEIGKLAGCPLSAASVGKAIKRKTYADYEEFLRKQNEYVKEYRERKKLSAGDNDGEQMTIQMEQNAEQESVIHADGCDDVVTLLKVIIENQQKTYELLDTLVQKLL